MAVLPDDIWHIITGKLQFRDLFSFYASHRHAKEIMGDSQVQKLKYWDPIFQDYEWVKAVDSRCQIPMLLFPNKERPYIYLLLGTPTKGNKDNVVKAKMAERGAREAKEALLNTVKKSLRSKTPGRHPCEVQFERFTLNISNVRYDPSPILFFNMYQYSNEHFQFRLVKADVDRERKETYPSPGRGDEQRVHRLHCGGFSGYADHIMMASIPGINNFDQVSPFPTRFKRAVLRPTRLQSSTQSLYIAIPTLEICIIYSQLIGTVKRSSLDEVYEDWIYTASGRSR
ncbi:hypothetical protein B0J15DRAFT_468304 [Fusarium solani]|uniref:F-box domain-containing protein n=1 Tax=Fusarium solani TaxID=169388 RepID=A0A9P9K529_FUSSL|nr:uncharacterized protein B0J15DRAFT_468304 [Fusarium solani]KAH7248293.1 hypothetical protein B0J15DRAFT_468304 [Fusarium solani]